MKLLSMFTNIKEAILLSVKTQFNQQAANVQCLKITYQCQHYDFAFGEQTSYGTVCFTDQGTEGLCSMSPRHILKLIHTYFSDWQGCGYCQLVKIEVGFAKPTEHADYLIKRLAKLEGGVYPMAGMAGNVKTA